MSVERRGFMMISDLQSRALRRKKSDLQLTDIEISKIIGLSRSTVSKILNGQCSVTKTVYQKAMEWLAEDY